MGEPLMLRIPHHSRQAVRENLGIPTSKHGVTTHFGTKIFGTTVLLLTRRAGPYSAAGHSIGRFAIRRILGETSLPGTVY